MTLLPSSGKGQFNVRGRFYYVIEPYLPLRPGQRQRQVDLNGYGFLLGLDGEILVAALNWTRPYGDVVMIYKDNEIRLLHRNGATVSHGIMIDFADPFPGLSIKQVAMTMQRPELPVQSGKRNS